MTHRHLFSISGLAVAAMCVSAAQGNGSDLADGSVMITQAQVDAGFTDLADTSAPGIFHDDGYDCTGWGVREQKDVFYGFIPERDMNLHIETCGADFDTLLWVYEDFQYAVCNEDGCLMSNGVDAFASKIDCFPVVAGREYYICVDGTNFPEPDPNEGTCTLLVREATPQECGAPCEVECPVGAIAEAEACGANNNGGCANLSQVPPITPEFEPINIGDTICGTGWFDIQTRDTDWYEVQIVTETKLIIECAADFRVLFGLAAYNEGAEGSGDCADHSGEVLGVQAQPCTPTTYTTDCLPPGTYWIFVGVDFGTALDPNETATVCGTLDTYWLTVTADATECGTGACCFETGFCLELNEAQCIGTGSGTFMGVGTTCEDGNSNGTADVCEADPCPWDGAPEGGDGSVGLGDLNGLLSNWGSCPAPCVWDFNDPPDGTVGLGDLNALLSNWGPCP
jgi:hypothetical protein